MCACSSEEESEVNVCVPFSSGVKFNEIKLIVVVIFISQTHLHAHTSTGFDYKWVLCLILFICLIELYSLCGDFYFAKLIHMQLLGFNY